MNDYNFKTYVINLDRDINNYYILKKQLKKRDIHLNRFPGIYGKNIKNYEKYRKHLSKSCEYFCPKSVIGCGLSHYVLLENIYNNYLQNRETEYTLILEDDVTPLFSNKKEIENILKVMPKNCDILSLYCQGYCNYDYYSNKMFIKGTKLMGSTAAYIVKNSSIPKIISKKIYNHIDYQRYNTKNIIIYNFNQKLFKVNNSTSYNIELNYNNTKLSKLLTKISGIQNIKLNELFSFKILRIPIINKDITLMNIINFFLLIIILIIIIFVIKKYKKI